MLAVASLNRGSGKANEQKTKNLQASVESSIMRILEITIEHAIK
jgi:hypothetical protein